MPLKREVSLNDSLCSILTRMSMMKSRNFMKRQLTVHDKPPFVLDGAVGYEWILSAACQILSIVLDHGNECEHAQRLIARLRELLINGKMSKVGN